MTYHIATLMRMVEISFRRVESIGFVRSLKRQTALAQSCFVTWLARPGCRINSTLRTCGGAWAQRGITAMITHTCKF
jgi:hypothetical protein